MSTEASDPANPPPTEFPEPERFDYASFACPRCGTIVSLDGYRPCDACVGELRATQRRKASTDEAAAYEPKMNVTPNAVALKDD